MQTSALSAPVEVATGQLPQRVRVFEVGPRDGLQNEATALPVEVKAEFVERLVEAGVREIELTSLVRPDRVPQLADAEELLRRLRLPDEVRTVVLTPNEKAVHRAVDAGVREVAVFASCTETFSRRNLGRSIDDSLRMFEPVVEYARHNGLSVRGYFSMVCGDPWEGAVPVDQVVAVARRLDDLGCTELSLGDTIGVGTPGQTVALIDAVVASGIDIRRLAVHLHDTYGQALANASAAIGRGVTVVDASAGGLGGCPFAGSSTGNLATEDLLWHLHGLDIETGIDLRALARTSAWLAGHLGRPSPSRAAQAIMQTPP
ncbi:hydroxymethylglutaryl-CoA lyase [Streptomyces sp. NPDC057690]|uniref:hydroxymethylglutaryl-CoA lyase n=1 Tax=Streptomyces sp. NPDC057690 TaxID=3346214 RepID=UPI0036B20131